MDYQECIKAYPPLYDESAIAPYALPPLRSRQETLTLLADHVYGHLPIATPEMKVCVVEEGPALDGDATRKQIRVDLANATGETSFHILLYLPAQMPESVPVFIGLNFKGNHAAQPDPAIITAASWMREPSRRGEESSRWPVAQIVGQGYAVATIYCGDLAPDDPRHSHEGILQLIASPSETEAATRGNTIAAWAWGLSRALDALITLPEIEPSRIALIGHSRLGKAALWSGACDNRFAIVISNNSGCGGAALSRRRIGERLVHINTMFPHWFAPAFHHYNEREHELPVDQHQLMALVAPRALYVSSAIEDKWADPYGEYLSLVAAAPAWGDSLSERLPKVDSPVHRTHLGYHLRTGKHGITEYDWTQYLAFANQVWKT